MKTATEVWRDLLKNLLGPAASVVEQVSAGASFRGRTNREILGYQTRWRMDRAVVACPARKMGYRFLTAEAAWVLSGDNRLVPIEPYGRNLKILSADGQTFGGAYGPPFIDQISYVTGSLNRDQVSRQAVMTLWRQRPGDDPDCPCTIALQWLIRGGELHCTATMRSGDAWLGVVYDVHTFSMMSAFVSLSLAQRQGSAPLPLGDLILTTGSQHLYKIDWDAAVACASRSDILFDLAPLDLSEFASPDELTAHLWSLARRDGVTGKRWLADLPRSDAS